MMNDELKKAFLAEILERKETLLTEFSATLTKEDKNQAWNEIHAALAASFPNVPSIEKLRTSH